MSIVQELMRAHPMEESSGATTTAPQIIKPKIPLKALICPLSQYQSYQLSQARQHKSNIVKSKTIKENDGAL